jgi:hypothetical protein
MDSGRFSQPILFYGLVITLVSLFKIPPKIQKKAFFQNKIVIIMLNKKKSNHKYKNHKIKLFQKLSKILYKKIHHLN